MVTEVVGNRRNQLLLGFQHIDAERWWISMRQCGQCDAPERWLRFGIGWWHFRLYLWFFFSLSNRRGSAADLFIANTTKSQIAVFEERTKSLLRVACPCVVIDSPNFVDECAMFRLEPSKCTFIRVRSARLQTDLGTSGSISTALTWLGRPTIETVSTQTRPTQFICFFIVEAPDRAAQFQLD